MASARRVRESQPDDYEVDGTTEPGLEATAEIMPEVPAEEFVAHDGQHIPRLFRVQTFVNIGTTTRRQTNGARKAVDGRY